MIDALREQQLRAFDEGASQFLARARQEGAAPVLRETLQLLVDTACGQPQRYLLLWSVAAGEPDALAAPPWRLDGIIQFFGQLIEIGVQRGEFAPRDPHTAALTVFSLYTGALLLRVSGRLPDSGQFAALLREAELVKSLLPVFNRRLRRARELCGFALEDGRVALVTAADLLR